MNNGNCRIYKYSDVLATTSGAIASFIATPTELSLIRMTSDGRLPAEQRRNYKHVFNALYRISKEEGVLALWRVSKTCDISIPYDNHMIGLWAYSSEGNGS